MAIITFEYTDKQDGWKLHTTTFQSVNLLVGLSGAGKTRIIEALRRVRHAALGGDGPGRRPRRAEWSLRLGAGGRTYLWEAATAWDRNAAADSDERTEPGAEQGKVVFVRERISDDEGNVIVDRTEEGFAFLETELPKLNRANSAISLLKDEAALAPIYKAVRQFLFSETGESDPVFGRGGLILYQEKVVAKLIAECQSVESLRERIGSPLLLKAHILQTQFANEFDKIVTKYREIFPLVTDVSIAPRSRFPVGDHAIEEYPFEFLEVAIREQSSSNWILSKSISSGMYETLVHLLEVALSPPGTVLLVDEYENSLGVNCLPALTDHLLSYAGSIQLILTSHHPYIINNIPMKWWRVVVRSGADVLARPSSDFPELTTKSAQDAFVLLSNSRAFEDGTA